MARIESGSPPPIVDVRSTSEFAASHVPGAVHVSFYALLFHLDELPEERGDERPLVVYCEHGPRAGMARAQLWLAGAGPVLFMEGHMTAWKDDGLPVETGDPSDRPALHELADLGQLGPPPRAGGGLRLEHERMGPGASCDTSQRCGRGPATGDCHCAAAPSRCC